MNLDTELDFLYRCCGHVVKLNFSIEDLVASQKRAAEQNTLLKMKLIDIQKQVKSFQAQGIQLTRVIDQCKAQKESIQTLEAQLDAQKESLKEESRRNTSLQSTIAEMKAQREETLRVHAEELGAVRAQLSDTAGEVRRLLAQEALLRAELDAARRTEPPSEHTLRDNAALRRRIKTLEEVYCPYG